MTRAASDAAALDRDTYRRLSLRWELWGLIAILTPLAALVLMVYKR